MFMYICACLHFKYSAGRCMHIYVHTHKYIHTYVHTYIHTDHTDHTCIHTYTYIHTYIHKCVHKYHGYMHIIHIIHVIRVIYTCTHTHTHADHTYIHIKYTLKSYMFTIHTSFQNIRKYSHTYIQNTHTSTVIYTCACTQHATSCFHIYM